MLDPVCSRLRRSAFDFGLRLRFAVDRIWEKHLTSVS